MKGRPPFDCPNCGAHVPAGAQSCPECGSDENTGWKEDASIYDGTDLEETAEFNHDEWMKKEGLAPTRVSGQQIAFIIATLLLLAVLAALVVRH